MCGANGGGPLTLVHGRLQVLTPDLRDFGEAAVTAKLTFSVLMIWNCVGLIGKFKIVCVPKIMLCSDSVTQCGIHCLLQRMRSKGSRNGPEMARREGCLPPLCPVTQTPGTGHPRQGGRTVSEPESLSPKQGDTAILSWSQLWSWTDGEIQRPETTHPSPTAQ